MVPPSKTQKVTSTNGFYTPFGWHARRKLRKETRVIKQIPIVTQEYPASAPPNHLVASGGPARCSAAGTKRRPVAFVRGLTEETVAGAWSTAWPDSAARS